MELYIRLKNGQPFEHPILGDNFREAFPDIDTEQLPEWVAKFERIAKPNIGVYEVYEGVTYEWSGNVVKDVHHVRQMSDEEKIAKQNAVKQEWAQNGYASWVFNEDICKFISPIAYPVDGKFYRWDELTTSWILVE